MDQGVFGLPIKAPGSLYWFNVSLMVLLVMSFQALMSGSFPIWFFLLALAISAVTGMKKPLLDAEELIRQPKGFLSYCVWLFLMANITYHYIHQQISFAGVISTVLAFIVGFYLGRYSVIERFSIVPPPAQPDEELPA
ncbi:hypothetical protein AGJ34_21495 [Cronobacter dublinensis subsp. dublinensis]|nr:hypothetical protein [Cronobacter dublinensis subsp. dublinensis]EGT5729857.1 hypothetical protein [Cronobacter dublinensis subsp. dublinensis]